VNAVTDGDFTNNTANIRRGARCADIDLAGWPALARPRARALRYSHTPLARHVGRREHAPDDHPLLTAISVVRSTPRAVRAADLTRELGTLAAGEPHRGAARAWHARRERGHQRRRPTNDDGYSINNTPACSCASTTGGLAGSGFGRRGREDPPIDGQVMLVFEWPPDAGEAIFDIEIDAAGTLSRLPCTTARPARAHAAVRIVARAAHDPRAASRT
jgi:hypothetical protein